MRLQSKQKGKVFKNVNFHPLKSSIVKRDLAQKSHYFLEDSYLIEEIQYDIDENMRLNGCSRFTHILLILVKLATSSISSTIMKSGEVSFINTKLVLENIKIYN